MGSERETVMAALAALKNLLWYQPRAAPKLSSRHLEESMGPLKKAVPAAAAPSAAALRRVGRRQRPPRPLLLSTSTPESDPMVRQGSSWAAEFLLMMISF